MTNNLETILPFLLFDSEDDFYHLQVIKRKKEHKELGSNSYVVKTYYISSAKYLIDKMDEIISICNYWWEEGNMSCDCNRKRFLPKDLLKEYNKIVKKTKDRHGGLIYIDKIIPLEGFDIPIPVLELNESELI